MTLKGRCVERKTHQFDLGVETLEVLESEIGGALALLQRRLSRMKLLQGRRVGERLGGAPRAFAVLQKVQQRERNRGSTRQRQVLESIDASHAPNDGQRPSKEKARQNCEFSIPNKNVLF